MSKLLVVALLLALSANAVSAAPKMASFLHLSEYLSVGPAPADVGAIRLSEDGYIVSKQGGGIVHLLGYSSDGTIILGDHNGDTNIEPGGFGEVDLGSPLHRFAGVYAENINVDGFIVGGDEQGIAFGPAAIFGGTTTGLILVSGQSPQLVILDDLPTSDPAIAGAIWRDVLGFIRVSGG